MFTLIAFLLWLKFAPFNDLPVIVLAGGLLDALWIIPLMIGA